MRHDYLINLLQSVVELIYFYHPGIRWISHHARNEREHCCDDIAMNCATGRLNLAKALLALQDSPDSLPAMAFIGQKGTFIHRVKRILAPRRHAGFSEGFSAACLLFVAMLILGLGIHSARATVPKSIAPNKLAIIQKQLDTPTEEDEDRVKMMHTPISMKKSGRLELSGEAEAENGDRPQLTSWLINDQSGEVVWHLLPRNLEKKGRNYIFKEVIHLNAGKYKWYVPQLGITISRHLDEDTASPVQAATAAPPVLNSAPAKDIIEPAPPSMVTRTTKDYDGSESIRKIDSKIRESGKERRRIRATIINGYVEKFTLNNITFLEEDINSNWEYVIRVLGEIESHYPDVGSPQIKLYLSGLNSESITSLRSRIVQLLTHEETLLRLERKMPSMDRR
ncbi:hypothetical protein KAR48_09550 [bacterium]|nr:hypothetical protein [bacterium]